MTNPPAATNEKRPLKVLHALGQLQRGGIEKWVFQVSQHMKKEGVECHVLTRTAALEPYTQDFRDAGITVIPGLGERNPFRYFANIRRILKEHGPYDVIHSHGPSISTVQLSLYARLLGGSKVLLHAWNDNTSLAKHKGFLYTLYLKLLNGTAQALADFRVACSTVAGDWMFGPGWKDKPKTKLLFVGIDFSLFFRTPDPTLRAKTGIPEGRFVLGHVGRYVRAKNHAYIVDIAEALLRHSPSFHFLFLGDGPLRSEVEAAFKARNMADHYTMVRDASDVPAYLCNVMNAFILPSFHEGLPLALVEAQGAALPCLVSDAVTPEAGIYPGYVTLLPIDGPAEVWAQEILALSRRELPLLPPEEHKKVILGSKFNMDLSVADFAKIYRDMSQK